MAELKGTITCPWCHENQRADDAFINEMNGVSSFDCTHCGQNFTEDDTVWKGRE